jgi:predicted deacylase
MFFDVSSRSADSVIDLHVPKGTLDAIDGCNGEKLQRIDSMDIAYDLGSRYECISVEDHRSI